MKKDCRRKIATINADEVNERAIKTSSESGQRVGRSAERRSDENKRKRINLSELTNFLDWNERREDTEKSEQTENIIKSNPFYCARARKIRFYHFHSESRQTFSSMKSAHLRTFGLLRRKLCAKRKNLLTTRALSVRLFEMV